MTTHEEPYVPTLPPRFPSYWKASTKAQELIRRLDPILPLLSGVRVDNEWTGFTTIEISIDSSIPEISATDEDDYLTLSMIVGCIPTSPENLAMFISHNQKGPWSYSIDDLGSDDIDDVESDDIDDIDDVESDNIDDMDSDEIDDVESNDQAVISLICMLHNREVNHLETWVLRMLKEYWAAQILIEKCCEDYWPRSENIRFIA